jgi:CRISPR/Cas system CSM-associated protein Csm2 small subunit
MKTKNLKVGEILSETQFYKVEEVKGDKITLKNDYGTIINIDKDYAEKCLKSAEQFDKVEKVSRTELVNIFMNSTNRAITVCFNKQLKATDAQKSMYELYANKEGKLLSEEAFKAKVDELLKSVTTGKERVMIGDFGRVNFIDMEAEKDPEKSYETRIKQVDTRTLNYCIVDGIKYEVK